MPSRASRARERTPTQGGARDARDGMPEARDYAWIKVRTAQLSTYISMLGVRPVCVCVLDLPALAGCGY